MADYQYMIDNFAIGYLRQSGDLKEKSIQRWHLSSDFYASGVFASGYFEDLFLSGPEPSGYVWTNKGTGWGSWEPNLGGTSGYSGYSGYSGLDGNVAYSGISGYSGVSGYSGTVNFVVASGVSTYYGETLTLTSTETQDVGDAVMIDSNGKAHLAKADAIANANAVLLAATAVTGSAVNIYLLPGGTLRLPSSPSWTKGGLIYLSATGTTGNTLAQSPPSSTNNVAQVLGVALTADTILFIPSLSQLEHT